MRKKGKIKKHQSKKQRKEPFVVDLLWGVEIFCKKTKKNR